MTIRQASNSAQLPEGGLRGWQLGVLAAGTFTLGVDGFVLSGLLPAIAHDLHLSVSAAGQLTTLFAVTYAVASPIIATLTGRWDRRVLLAGGLVLFLIGMAGQALAPSFAVMAVGRVVAAIGAAAFQSNAYAMAGILSSPQRRGRALAAVTAGTSLSTVLGVPLGVLIGQWAGWRAMLWIIAGLAVLTAVVVPLLPSAHVPPTDMRTRVGVLVRPPVLLLLLATVATVAPPFLLISYLPTVLGMAQVDGTNGRLIAVLLVFGIGNILGNRLVGRQVDARGALPVLTVGLAGLAVLSAVLVATRDVYGAALAVLLLLGLFQGLTITPQQHRLFGIAPDASTVTLGLNGSAIYLGAALGAALGGLALDTAGAAAIPTTAAILAALALTLILTTAPDRRPIPTSPPVSPASPPTSSAAPPVAAQPTAAPVSQR